MQTTHSQSATTVFSECFDPLKDGISSVQLLRVSGSDIDVVNGARVSFGKYVTQLTEKDIKLIRYLMQHNHTSPFEHNQLSFRIKAPLFVIRQWMRHRMNSYNEISYRYVEAPLEFYIPSQWRYQHASNRQASAESFTNNDARDAYMATIDTARTSYTYLLEKKVCRELARGILPLCTYSEFIFTCNLHSLTHFLKLRLHPGAQYEIQEYARALLFSALPYFYHSLTAWRDCYAPEVIFPVQENQPTHPQIANP